MDDEEPGALPAVTHVDLPISMPPRTPPRAQPVVTSEEKKDDKDDFEDEKELPFDEINKRRRETPVREIKKKEQLKELDDIVAKIEKVGSSDEKSVRTELESDDPEHSSPSSRDEPGKVTVMDETPPATPMLPPKLHRKFVPIEVSDVTTDEDDAQQARRSRPTSADLTWDSIHPPANVEVPQQQQRGDSPHPEVWESTTDDDCDLPKHSATRIRNHSPIITVVDTSPPRETSPPDISDGDAPLSIPRASTQRVDNTSSNRRERNIIPASAIALDTWSTTDDEAVVGKPKYFNSISPAAIALDHWESTDDEAGYESMANNSKSESSACSILSNGEPEKGLTDSIMEDCMPANACMVDAASMASELIAAGMASVEKELSGTVGDEGSDDEETYATGVTDSTNNTSTSPRYSRPVKSFEAKKETHPQDLQALPKKADKPRPPPLLGELSADNESVDEDRDLYFASKLSTPTAAEILAAEAAAAAAAAATSDEKDAVKEDDEEDKKEERKDEKKEDEPVDTDDTKKSSLALIAAAAVGAAAAAGAGMSVFSAGESSSHSPTVNSGSTDVPSLLSSLDRKTPAESKLEVHQEEVQPVLSNEEPDQECPQDEVSEVLDRSDKGDGSVAGDQSVDTSSAFSIPPPPPPSDEVKNEDTNGILKGAAFGAVLLGLNSSQKDKLIDMPKDERLEPPDGMDLYAEGPIATARSIDSADGPGVSGNPVFIAPAAMARSPIQEEDDKMEEVNISYDHHTEATEVNMSHIQEEFVDEEQAQKKKVSRELSMTAEEKEEDGSRRKRKLCVILVVAFFLLGIILLGAGLGTNGFSAASSIAVTTSPTLSPSLAPSAGPTPEPTLEPTPEPTPGPTLSRSAAFSSFIQNVSLADRRLLANQNSAEARSMNWLVNDDELALDPSDVSPRNDLIIRQRYSLATVWFSSLEDTWTDSTNWLGENECDWFGVECSGRVVVGINLEDNQVMGTLSAELGLLDFLSSLVLRENEIGGTLPGSLGLMPRLGILDLLDNNIGGELGAVDFTGMALDVLELTRNNLKGPIPESLYTMSALSRLRFRDNDLTGSISSEIGSLVNLDRFVVDGNDLTGTLPSEIGLMQALTVFDVARNELVGSIPVEVGSMQSLQHFVADTNGFTGSIPPSVGFLPNLETLRFPDNNLDGFIPAELENAPMLKQLNLQNNQLGGTIPDGLGAIQTLEVLQLGNNPFDRSIFPDSLYNLVNLITLFLQGTNLSGSLSPEIGNLVNLVQLRIDSNFFNETLPTEIGNMQGLQQMRIDSNQFSGFVPTEIGSLVNILDMRFTSNQLSGVFPEEVGNLARLQQLGFGGNLFTGQIPNNVTQLQNLQILLCADNFLDGTIPEDIGDMESLEVFWCHLNRFDAVNQTGLSGGIPTSIGNLENLRVLSLWQNGLTGEIPSELGNCRNLEILDLELNSLEGAVPDTFGDFDSLETLRLGGNDLSSPLPSSVCEIDSLTTYRVGCGLVCSCCTELCGSRAETSL